MVAGSPPAGPGPRHRWKGDAQQRQQERLGRLERAQNEAPVGDDGDASDSRRAQNQDLIAKRADEVDHLYPQANPEQRADTPAIVSRPHILPVGAKAMMKAVPTMERATVAVASPHRPHPMTTVTTVQDVIDHHGCGLGGRDSLVEELALDDDEAGTPKSA